MRQQKLLAIFVSSVAALYLQLLLIRWVGTEFNIFAYLQNSVLVVCLLGMGMGFLFEAGAERSLKESNLSLLALSVMFSLPGVRDGIHALARSLSWFHDFTVWDETAFNGRLGWLCPVLGLMAVAIVALQIWRIVLPYGVVIGAMMNSERRLVAAYSVNILGSLIGILLFALLGALGMPPACWVFVGIILIVATGYFAGMNLGDWRYWAPLSLALAASIVGGLAGNELETVWSPYQKLAVLPSDEASEFKIYVNNAGYQMIQNNSAEHIAQYPEKYPGALLGVSQYDLPARFMPQAKEVLVVGAGTGNDVAGILRNNPRAKVTAVEIDPEIIRIGRERHPEKPYQSERVELVLDDARSFFQRTNKRFDLIIFGLLDSHTSPVMTTARLDHYVYTAESLHRVKELLSDTGVICLSFLPQRSFIAARLARELTDQFGEIPVIVEAAFTNYGWGGMLFVAGNQGQHLINLKNDPRLTEYVNRNRVNPKQQHLNSVVPISDDWPYLYLEKPAIPSLFYFLALVLALLWWVSWRSLRKRFQLRLGTGSTASQLELAALGAGFMLVEAFGVSQGAILFGSTWQVNAIVVSGVMLMVLAANLVVFRFPHLSRHFVYLLLFASILLLYGFPYNVLFSLGELQRAIVYGLIVPLPLFFSGYCFTRLLTESDRASAALGVNLLGALLGGMTQLSSFRFGIRALIVFAAVAYLIAFASSLSGKLARANAPAEAS